MLHRFHRGDTRYSRQGRRRRGRDDGARGLGDGDVGAVGELRVGFGLLGVGGVERRRGGCERQRQSEQHDRAGHRSALPGQPGRHRCGEASGEGSQHLLQQRTSAVEQEVRCPPGQEPGADPQQGGSGQGPVGHRDGRYALGGEHQLVAVATGRAEHEAGDDEQRTVESVTGPGRVPQTADGGPSGGHRAALQITAGGHQDGEGGDEQPDGSSGDAPDDRIGGRISETRGAEGDLADHGRTGQSQH